MPKKKKGGKRKMSETNNNVADYKFSNVFGGRRAILSSQGKVVFAELDNQASFVTSRNVRIEEKDFSRMLDVFNKSLDDIAAHREVKPRPLQNKDINKKLSTIYVVCLTSGLYNDKNLVHLRSYIKRPENDRFQPTTYGLTLKSDADEDQLLEILEHLEEAILAGSNVPSGCIKKIQDEAEEIVDRNPDMVFADIGRLTFQHLRSNSRLYTYRQAIANVVGCRYILDRQRAFDEKRRVDAKNNLDDGLDLFGRFPDSQELV